VNAELSVSIEAFAIAGPGAEHAAAHQRVELPPPGTKRRGGRLPLLATALARQATDTTPHESAAVLFGTSLGCLTETGLFVEHMIEAEEATPKPRAFSSSVHNAIASKVALDLAAHGACQTFVHGEASFVHALLTGCLIARRTHAPVYVGALDESSKFVDRALAGCGVHLPAAEGGAVLRLGQESATGPRVTRIGFGREVSPAWFDGGSSLVTVPGFDGSHAEIADARRAPFTSFHPSLTAVAAALATGILREETTPAALDLQGRQEAITLVTKTRFGDHTAIRIEG
jgi:Beta-ketoacyl synthase, N-terminal domain